MNTTRGTWLVLVGLLLYLGEFLGMAIAGGYPSNTPETPTQDIATTYQGFEDGAGLLVGWMAVVLLGRILIVVGFRQALGAGPLLDWALGAMVVSVALEVTAVGLLAATARLVAGGADGEAVLALDHAAWAVGSGVAAPVGLAVLLCAVALWRGSDLPRWLAGVGLVAGALTMASGLLTAPSAYPLASTLSIGVVLFWGWTLWTGVLLARRARRPSAPDERPGGVLHDRGEVGQEA